MSNVLDGGWGSTPNAMTITIPLPDNMFARETNPEVVADFVSGLAARLAREEYILRYAQTERDRTEAELTKAQREKARAEAWRLQREWQQDQHGQTSFEFGSAMTAGHVAEIAQRDDRKDREPQDG